jgi:hypothetical protein
LPRRRAWAPVQPSDAVIRIATSSQNTADSTANAAAIPRPSWKPCHTVGQNVDRGSCNAGDTGASVDRTPCLIGGGAITFSSSAMPPA